jgi:Ulp1 family protease
MLSWTKNVKLNDYDIVFIPIHSPDHWSLVVNILI